MEEMIRDHIVVSIHDHVLSKRLQTVADLTLEKAKTCSSAGTTAGAERSCQRDLPIGITTYKEDRPSGSQC